MPLKIIRADITKMKCDAIADPTDPYYSHDSGVDAQIHEAAGGGKIRFGIYACSPEDSSFTATFTELSLSECRWLPHDGQQSDAE